MNNLQRQAAVMPLSEAYLNFLATTDSKLLEFLNAEIRWDRRRAWHTYRWAIVDHGHVTPCWIWQGRLFPNGYSARGANNKTYYGHRYYYEKFHRVKITQKLDVDHLCRIRCCVNPRHLEPVTRIVNIMRGSHPKLTEEKVVEMRRLAAEGWTAKALGTKYGVSGGHVCRVLNGKIGVWAQ